ncbi:uncharacterized protein BCR38DRAFT_25553 [Pseudomassariella vexata]|uniref:Uncharacterized protein n=1 Tax=Pseudomassariella vexata TaxID=1141098 RepID=A0A1Y2EKF9_9PEZI|nr:uncharacterized protein BCR38DRAFT_25553 [Pseudomassariella vexata]ORY72018.1 hypothetical protein BCR38DRAFT_25553 [Pseudomassariella vexata]
MSNLSCWEGASNKLFWPALHLTRYLALALPTTPYVIPDSQVWLVSSSHSPMIMLPLVKKSTVYFSYCEIPR